MSTARTDLAALRRQLAALERGPALGASGLFSFGCPAIDGVLGGGLARGAVHEIFACQVADTAAASGYAAALALRAAGERTIAWVRQDFVDAEAGWLYAPGLAAFGIDPDRLVLVRTRDTPGALRAGAAAARCPALGAVLIELWGAPKMLDLTVIRRLSLAAARSGVTLFMIRLGATPAPSAALTRWEVRAAASSPREANAPGLPVFTVTLLRHRAGLPGRTWLVEWNRDRRVFTDTSPLSRGVVPVPASRPAAAARNGSGLRHAG